MFLIVIIIISSNEECAREEVNLVRNNRWEDLKLKGMALDAIPDNIFSLSGFLVKLDVCFNKLKDCTPVCVLTNLAILKINYNSLTALPAELGLLTNLHSLDAGANGLTVLPDEIGCLTNMTYLNVGCNCLDVLPETLQYLAKLISTCNKTDSKRCLSDYTSALS